MLFQIRRCIYHPLAAHRLLPVPAPKLRVHTYSEKWRRSPHTARMRREEPQSAVAAAACAGRGVALVPSSLVSPVLSPPAGFFANSSPEGRGKPAPAPCACLSHCFQGCKPSHCPRAGQRDIDKKEPQLGNTSGVLGFPCVRFWQSPHMGFACIISQTFHRRRAVQVGEVRHPARRP